MATETNRADRPAGQINLPAVETSDEIEEYTPERIAEFLLNCAVGADGYAAAREEVKALGLDPDQIPHEKPPGA